MRILYATDGSRGAVSALDLIVTSLAPDRVEHVEVVTVAPPPPAWPSVRPTGDPLVEGAWETGHRLAAEAPVQPAIDRLRAGGFAGLALLCGSCGRRGSARRRRRAVPDAR